MEPIEATTSTQAPESKVPVAGQAEKKRYEPPRIEELGSVSQLTGYDMSIVIH
jgi:hypothetical protein